MGAEALVGMNTQTEPNKAPYDPVAHEQSIVRAIEGRLVAIIDAVIALSAAVSRGNFRRARYNQLLAEMEAINLLDWIDSLDWVKKQLVEWRRRQS